MAFKKLNDADRYSLLAYLKGSCSSVIQGLQLQDKDDSDYDVDQIELSLLEDIELCDVCGWWHETDEMNDMDGDRVCTDCWCDAAEDGERAE